MLARFVTDDRSGGDILPDLPYQLIEARGEFD